MGIKSNRVALLDHIAKILSHFMVVVRLLLPFYRRVFRNIFLGGGKSPGHHMTVM